MKGLLLKDFYMTVKSCKMYFIVDALFIIMSFAFSGIADDSFTVLMFPILIAGEISISLMNHEEKSQWTKYSNTLPYSAGQIVSSKYIFSILFVLFTTLVTFLAVIIYVNIIGGAELSQAGAVVGGICIVSLIVPAVGLPLCFKFGTERGRIIFFFALFLGAFGIGALGSDALAKIDHMVWIIIAAAVVIYALSWFISVSIYSKREVTG